MLNEKNILNALSGIIDPDFNKDIVSLGFVKNIKMEEGNVSFDIELTTPACPIKEEFKQQAEEAVMALDGIKSVSIQMTSKKKSKAASFAEKSTLRQINSIIAISSCKGGVGKSTVAAQLAQELARRGFKVGLVDADVHGPSVPSLFNLKNVVIYSNDQQQLIPVEKNGLKLMSFGFLLGDAPAVIRGPIISQYIQQILHNTAWGELDYLFIDMPPGTGDIHLTITQTVQLSGAVIVTTPQTLSLIDVARGILMFEKVNVPILGLIENMSYFQCDSCDKKHYLFGKNTSQSLNDRFGIEMLAELPLLPQLTLPVEGPLANEYIMQAADKTMMALGKSSIAQKQVPEIKSDEKNITLTWKNGETLTIGSRDLRLNCRCALCVDELTGEKILKDSDILENIAPEAITPLGNYAIGITWNDGHSSGIYPYKSMRELVQVTLSE